MNTTARAILIFLFDLISVVVAWVGGFLIRFNFDWPFGYNDVILAWLGVLLVAHTVACRWAGLYRGMWIFASLPDLKRVLKAVVVSLLVLIGLFILDRGAALPIPRSVLILYPLLLLVFMGGGRVTWRMWREHRLYGGLMATGKPVVVVGAGSGGAMLVRQLERSTEWRVVALVDDDPKKWGLELLGHPVIGAIKRLPFVLQNFKAQHVILAMPSATKAALQAATDLAVAAGAHVFTVPGLADLMSGKVAVSAMRPVEIEDLLGRESVEPNASLLEKCIAGKIVLVSGAGGSIGSELCRQIVHLKPLRLVLMEISEFALYSVERELRSICEVSGLNVELVPLLASVTNFHRNTQIMACFDVQTVYHAAAYKHVPLVEHNPIEGIRNNTIGTQYMAEAALAAGVETFVLISTDKAVRPSNVMGASKRLAELVLQGLARQGGATRFCMVRFGNVLGSSGSVVPLFRKQIAAGGPITLTHPEITRYFMTIPEAAQLVIQAGAMSIGGEVYVLDMGEPVRIFDLAMRMVHLSGFEVRDAETPDGEISIEIVGLRPGEKLYEELLIGDNVEQTSHPLIMRAYEHEVAWPELLESMKRLNAACQAFDCEEALNLLLEMVEEYAPVRHEGEELVWNFLRRSVALGTERLH